MREKKAFFYYYHYSNRLYQIWRLLPFIPAIKESIFAICSGFIGGIFTSNLPAFLRGVIRGFLKLPKVILHERHPMDRGKYKFYRDAYRRQIGIYERLKGLWRDISFRRGIVPLIVIALVLSGLKIGYSKDQVINIGDKKQDRNSMKIDNTSIGIENVPWNDMAFLKKSLPIFKELGIGLLGRNALSWGWVEPVPPKGGIHQYRWNRLDEEFKIYHELGFQLQIELKSRSTWGTVVSERWIKAAGGSPPKDEYWDDWGYFVYELVERYDGDGYRDAFPIKFPIIRIISVQGVIEFPGHWKKNGGTVENYDRLLKMTKEFAHKADTNVKIARAGTSVGDFFDSNPSLEEIKKVVRMNRASKEFYNVVSFAFEHHDSFDLFGIHANRDYTGIWPFINYINIEMADKGYKKPILIEDASSVVGMSVGELSRSKDSNKYRKIVEQYKILEKGVRYPGYENAISDVYAHQAALTIKKATLSLFSSAESILFIGFMDNLKSDWISFRHGGFIDSNIYERTMDIRKSLKPVYYALKMFIQRVNNADIKVDRLDSQEDIHIFKFIKEGHPIYIMWTDGSEKIVEIPLNSEMAITTPIITMFGKQEPEQQIVKVKNNKLSLSLSGIPVFVEEAR